MNDPIQTLVNDQERQRLAKSPDIGAGNFLQFAVDVNRRPDQPILFLERGLRLPDHSSSKQLSLKDLQQYSDQYAAWYLSQGVRPQDLVGVYMEDGIEYLLHYLALTRIGAVAVLTNGNMEPSIAAAHMKRTGCIGVITDCLMKSKLEEHVDEKDFSFLTRHRDISWTESVDAVKQFDFRHSNGDPIMIAHSSGTTGIPKAVLLEHDKFFYGIRSRLEVPKIEGGEKILSSLPHSHNCAIAYIMLALLSGTPVFIASDHTGRSVLDRIEEFRPTMVVSFPQTYVTMVEDGLENRDLTSVQLWFNGGDAAHEPHIRALIDAGSHIENGQRRPGAVFVDGMGSSEMGFSLFKNIHTLKTNRYQRCVGKPHSWVDAAILDDHGKQVENGTIGRLGVKAPSVTSGYWNDSNLTYKSRLSGYFLTGDLAYRDQDGYFFHVDRVPDKIHTRDGIVYSLWTEELILSRFEEISDCSVFAKPIKDTDCQSASCVVRLHNGHDATEVELLERINDELDTAGRPPLSELTFVRWREVPLGTTGKVLKRDLRVHQANA